MSEINKTLSQVAEFALDLLKSAGTDGASVTVSKNQVDELNVDAGEFSLLRTTLGSSFGISALVDGKRGSASTNKLDKESVKKAAINAVESAKASEPDDGWAIAPDAGEHSYSVGDETAKLNVMYERKKEFLEDSKVRYPKLDVMQFVTKFTHSNSLYANSNGSRLYSGSEYYTSFAEYSAREGDNVTSMFGSGVITYDFDKALLDYVHFRKSIEEMEAQLHTVPVKGKFVGTLVCSPDVAYELIDAALSGATGDSTMIQGISPWKDKLGQAVAQNDLTLLFDPSDDRIVDRGGAKYTSDGYLAAPQYAIKNGVLESFLLSQYGARKLKADRAANYGSGPVVTAGGVKYDDIIAGVQDGLFINRFSGGAPAQNGDFSGVAKNSFLIKNGKITEAVSETMVSGNIFAMLNNIIAISSDTIADGSSVLPYMAFGGVTISGK